MKNTLRNVSVLTAGFSVVLTGCATSKTARDLQNSGNAVALDRYESIRTPRMENRSFVVDDGFHAARRPISVVPVNPSVVLPPSFAAAANMNVQSPIAITEIGSRITKMTGVPVTVDQDVLASSGGSSASTSTAPVAPPLALPGAGPLPSDPSAPPMGLPPLPTSVELSSAPSDTVLQDLVYRGNLSGLLDEVTGRLNLSWRWTGNRIEIFRYETKMFRLNSLAGRMSSNSNLNMQSSTSQGGSGGGGGGGSSGNSGNTGSSGSNISVSNEMEVWQEVEDNLKEMLSQGGKLTVAPSAGTITVRDTPSVLRQIESQVGEFNRIYSKQVTLHVEIYAIERSRTESYGLNWDAVWAHASRSLGFSFSSAGASGAGPAFTIGLDEDSSSPLAGSSIVAQALSTIGNTSLVTSGTVISRNGETVPLNVSREVAYLQSSSTNFNGSDNGLATTTLTPGVATEGFSMNFTPRILDNNQVLVRYSIDLATIEEITTFTAPGGGNAIQLPRRAVRNFLQNVSIPSGQSLVLTGFQQAQGSRSGEGPFSPNAWFLGGNKNSRAGSQTIVIVVTPYISQQ